MHGLVELALVKCAHVAVQRPFQNVDRASDVAVIRHQGAPVKMDMEQFVGELAPCALAPMQPSGRPSMNSITAQTATSIRNHVGRANRSDVADVRVDMSNTTDSNSAASNAAPAFTPPSAARSAAPSTWIKRGIIGLVVLVALVYGAIFFYANVLNDAPDALDTDDLSEALETTVVEADDEPSLETAPSAAAPDEAAADSEDFDGLWTPTTASEFGYRVDEVLGGVNVTAVGRSSEIDGSLTIEGTTASVDATVEVENIVSDDSRRDGQFQGRIMDVANFPTANFQTTEPINFGAIPADGEQVTATAVGELTLKGVTQTVTVDVTAQATGTSIGVLGNIPITFTDYGIDNPSNPGVSLEDEGIVEFVLVFERG